MAPQNETRRAGAQPGLKNRLRLAALTIQKIAQLLPRRKINCAAHSRLRLVLVRLIIALAQIGRAFG